MLQFLQDVFQQIAEFFTKVWDIITFIFDEITQFFKMIMPAVQFFVSLLVSLPPVFKVFGIAMISVLILYIILGRTAGGD